MEKLNTKQESGSATGVKQFKVAIDKKYATAVIPRLQHVFLKNNYRELFRLALAVLAFHAEVLESNYRLLEVGEHRELGVSIAVIAIMRLPHRIIIGTLRAPTKCRKRK